MQEIQIAVEPEEVAPITEALATDVNVTCVARSGQPDDPGVASDTPGYDPLSDFHVIDTIIGNKREAIALPMYAVRSPTAHPHQATDRGQATSVWAKGTLLFERTPIRLPSRRQVLCHGSEFAYRTDFEPKHSARTRIATICPIIHAPPSHSLSTTVTAAEMFSSCSGSWSSPHGDRGARGRRRICAADAT